MGINTVNIVVSDALGNSTNCSATVTVVDNSAPDLETFESITLDMDNSGSVILNASDMMVNLTDNCDAAPLVTLSHLSLDCNNMGVNVTENLIVNGSFENDLTGWESEIINSNPSTNLCIDEWKVAENSLDICFGTPEITPTDGLSAAYTSFDSNFSNVQYALSQNLNVPDNIIQASIEFDWKAELNLTSATQTKVFQVQLFEASGAYLSDIYRQTFAPGSTYSFDTTTTVDLTALLSNHLSQQLELRFTAFMPEAYAGVGKFLVDNVQLDANFISNTTDVMVTATDGSGNTTTSMVAVVLNDPGNVCTASNSSSLLENSIRMFPNPASTAVQLEWNPSLTIDQLVLFDVNGRSIIKRELGEQSSGSASLELGTIADGVYFINLKTQNGNATRKLIVQRK